MRDSVAPSPWYREPWPWLLMAGPAIVVVAGFVTLGLALSGNDGLVVDDYYKQGKAINQSFARDETARARALAATIDLDTAHDRIDVRLTQRDGLPPPHELRLTLAHATRSGLDRRVHLHTDGAVLAGALPPLAPGKWHLVLEDMRGEWRLTQTVVVGATPPPRIKLTAE